MAQNIRSLQLLRNSVVKASYQEAINAITGSTTQDGVIKLARYYQNGTDVYSGDTNGSIKTIFGIYHEAMDGKDAGYTIYESYKELIDKIQEKIDAMGGEGGSIEQQIKAAIEALDYSGVTTGDGVVVTNVTETDGVVSATSANVGGLKLTGYEEGESSGHVEASDSINAAIAKLQNQIDAANDAKNAAIDALDYSDAAVAGEYVSQVTETDGIINVTRVALPSLAEVHEAGKPIIAVSEDKGQLAASAGTINAEYVNVTGNTFTSSTVQGALEEIETEYKAADAALKEEILGDATTSGNTLGKLEDRIEALDADAATYTVKKVTTGLATNVKEQYVLVETKNGTSVDKEVAIPIYKDNTLKSVELVDQALQFTYIVDSGESVVSVDVSKFLAESEFASGVTVNSDGVAHGVVDQTSESFLTVGADGFKLDGVQAAIDAASGDVKSKLDELSGKTEALSGKTVTGIEMTGGTANVVDNTADGTKKITINADGSTLSASTRYASATTASAVAAGDSIDTALGKLEAQVAAAKAAATTKVVEGTDAGNNLEIVSTTGGDQSVTYTISLTDVASKTALDAEIAARKAVEGQSGQTYAANTGANYISNATSLNDADVKLGAALFAESNRAKSAEAQIDEAIGLTKASDSETRTYTNTGEYIGKQTRNTVASDIKALDTQVKANADAISALQTNYVSGATMNNKTVSKANNVLAFTAKYNNQYADGANGMVITTDNDGGLTFQFGTIDAGTY